MKRACVKCQATHLCLSPINASALMTAGNSAPFLRHSSTVPVLLILVTHQERLALLPCKFLPTQQGQAPGGVFCWMEEEIGGSSPPKEASCPPERLSLKRDCCPRGVVQGTDNTVTCQEPQPNAPPPGLSSKCGWDPVCRKGMTRTLT